MSVSGARDIAVAEVAVDVAMSSIFFLARSWQRQHSQRLGERQCRLFRTDERVGAAAAPSCVCRVCEVVY
jgi:hypothetical protein